MRRRSEKKKQPFECACAICDGYWAKNVVLGDLFFPVLGAPFFPGSMVLGAVQRFRQSRL